MSTALPSKWGDLAVRTASALILIPLVIFSAWAGGLWFVAFSILLGCLIGHEWTRIAHAGDVIQYVFHLVAPLLVGLLMTFANLSLALTALVVLALMAATLSRFSNSKRSVWSYLGVAYAGLPVAALILLRQDQELGFAAIVWIFAIVWGADVTAYFAGRSIGGPKLAPRISPKKTWAGLVGAVVGSTAASLVVAHVFALPNVAPLVLIAGALAIVEQAGDLFESLLKRYFGVKDSGNLIPGHGGVIDRVDGLIVVAIAAAAVGILHGKAASAAVGLLVW